VLNLLLSFYVLVIIFTYWNEWDLGSHSGCIGRLSFFIVLFAYVQGFEVLRKIVLIYTWKTQDDPGVLQAKIDFFFIFLVVIPELLIYIYGNFIFYAKNQDACEYIAGSLWNCSLIIIIYGYLYMFYALGFVLFFIGVFVMYRAWSLEASTETEQDALVEKLNIIPMVGNAETQRRLALRRETRTTEALLAPDMSGRYTDMSKSVEPQEEIASCQICKLDLRPFDPVVACEQKHLFHEDCFQTKINESKEIKDLSVETCPVCQV